MNVALDDQSSLNSVSYRIYQFFGSAVFQDHAVVLVQQKDSGSCTYAVESGEFFVGKNVEKCNVGRDGLLLQPCCNSLAVLAVGVEEIDDSSLSFVIA